MMAALLTCIILATAQQEYATACQEGRKLANTLKDSAFSSSQQVVAEEFIPESDRGKSFDPWLARQQVLGEERGRSEVVDFLLDEQVRRNERENSQISGDDWMLARSEEIVDGSHLEGDEIEEGELGSRLERCVVKDAPQEIVLVNELVVEIVRLPPKEAEAHSCLGHSGSQKYRHPDDAWQAEKDLNRQLATDPSIASYDVWLEKGRMGHRDRVVWEYWHHRNHPNCDHFQTISVFGTQEQWEERDHWSLDRSRLDALLSDPNTTLLERVCVEGAGVREIDGRRVERPLWKEEYRFVSFDPNAKKSCLFFHEQRCDLVRKRCLEEGTMGCVSWEFLFKCWEPSLVARPRIDSMANPAEEAYLQEANSGFSEVVTKLSVFADIKEQIANASASDVTRLALFAGHPNRCSKSVGGEVMYDCCFSMGGFAKEMQLARCTHEEIHLAELRERGLCHYIGSHSEKFLEMWKSRKVHTFCCFSSKLARVFQEEGRKQLDLSWGNSESPNCRGLLSSEVSQLNFSQLDLSELYEIVPDGFPHESEERLTDLRSRIRRRIEEVGDAAA